MILTEVLEKFLMTNCYKIIKLIGSLSYLTKLIFKSLK
jgi:hypothetical protein